MVLFGSMNAPKLDPIKEVKRIAKQGFDFVDFTIETRTRVEYLDTTKTRKQIEDLGLGIVGSTDWRLPTASPYPAVRKASCNEMIQEMGCLADLGAGVMTIHFDHSSSGFERRLSLEREIESYHLFSDKAKELGVTIVVENFEGTDEHRREIGALLKATPSLFLHLDVGHTNRKGGNIGIRKFIRGYNKKIRHLHISDNHGDQDEHLGVGFGTINWGMVLRELKRIGYDETITFETFRPKGALLKSFSQIKKMWEDIR
jgi:sugar phosphate isomerase/epimerase